jgi:hypothetical protein
MAGVGLVTVSLLKSMSFISVIRLPIFFHIVSLSQSDP